jgi:hypothetical protein
MPAIGAPDARAARPRGSSFTGRPEVLTLALQLIQPRDKFMLSAHVVDRNAVIGHLRSVLGSFASKPEYSKFYIGITNEVETRLSDHRIRKPDFKVMVPVYEEDAILVENAFDVLEQDAIRAFSNGIRHPTTNAMMLKCENGPGGARPKRVLYILVG